MYGAMTTELCIHCGYTYVNIYVHKNTKEKKNRDEKPNR